MEEDIKRIVIDLMKESIYVTNKTEDTTEIKFEDIQSEDILDLISLIDYLKNKIYNEEV